MRSDLKSIKGFTPIAVLFGVAIFSFLATYMLSSINPGERLAETRNAQRQFDIGVILKAVYQYAVDNGGVFPSVIADSDQYVCKIEHSDCNGISLEVLVPDYLVDLPKDPEFDGNMTTGYKIRMNQNRIVVTAPHSELNTFIKATR